MHAAKKTNRLNIINRIASRSTIPGPLLFKVKDVADDRSLQRTTDIRVLLTSYVRDHTQCQLEEEWNDQNYEENSEKINNFDIYLFY